MTVKKGDKVKIGYTGKFDDGCIFDSSDKHGQPLEFEVGTGQVIPGFDTAVIGMEVGSEKDIKIEPKEGYGEYDQRHTRKVPKSQLPQGNEPKKGMMLMVGMPNGQQVPATITEVNDSDVLIDFNHPLAGKNLNFKIKLVEINK